MIQLEEEADGTLNYGAASKANLNRSTFENRVRDALMKINGIADVYFRHELEDTSTTTRPYLELFRNSYSSSRGGDFEIRFCEYCLASDVATGTSHGSPYAYDTHVPIVFWGTGVHTGKSPATAHTVDIAPTLATALAVKYPASIDGKPLRIKP